MNGKYTTTLLVLIFTFGGVCLGQAADTGGLPGTPSIVGTPTVIPSPMNGTSPSNTPSNAPVLDGTVENVDTLHNSIQVEDATGKTQTITVDPSTQIMREGTAVQLTDVRTGDSVTIKNGGTF